jgi:lipopolysaccharide export system protein LptA
MRRSRDVMVLLLAATALSLSAVAAPDREVPKGGGLFGTSDVRNSKEPITITSDSLEYDYKANVVVYRGEVLAIQGTVKLRSDTLTVTLERRDGDAAAKTATPKNAAPESPTQEPQRVHEIVAVGGVRIDDGARWATGGRAVFEQAQRTVVLTEEPVLHDGANEVAGERVVVYLDENRSIVEGGRRRVKAVLHPGKDNGLAPAGSAARAQSGEPGTGSAAAQADEP